MEIPVEEAPPDGPVDQLTPRQRRQAIVAATLGNGLEFYDFVTFAFFAIQIGHTFFPSESAFLSLMGSLATFGAGFITRPIGAFFLGGYADRHGRKPAMLISMSMMGLGIALLALTPGYAAIGIAAPILAVIARLLQGFALGGEVGSATIYMMESAKDLRRAYTMSWQGTSQNIAATAGAGVGVILSMVMSDAELSAYGWRIALMLGVTIVPVALYIRRTLPETIHQADTAVVDDSEGLRSYLRPVVCGLIIIGSGTIATYIFNYMATYGQDTLGLSSTLSLLGEFANNGIGIVSIMIGGLLSDRFGRKLLMVWPQLLFTILVVPCFLWLTTSRDTTSFIGANLILSFFAAMSSGALYAAISESIPKAVRARAFALVYALPVTFLGGSTQLVVTWILHVTGSAMSIAWYLTVVSLLGLLAMFAMKESAPVKLQAAAKG
ncbi:MFS transporter [Tsuneonella mangrovi]|uniref:MFS transporter n=1 Tax=Tsuneonella mangrovi TaxID=1982042 RepID=UPI000BA1C7A1|nr:MFS transporter [Tsuneonella mangrovi]